MEYLHFLHENESLDCDGLISDNGGSAISLSSDGGLKLVAQRARAKQKMERWEVIGDEGGDGNDQVCILRGAGAGRDCRGVWGRGWYRGRRGRVC